MSNNYQNNPKCPNGDCLAHYETKQCTKGKNEGKYYQTCTICHNFIRWDKGQQVNMSQAPAQQIKGVDYSMTGFNNNTNAFTPPASPQPYKPNLQDSVYDYGLIKQNFNETNRNISEVNQKLGKVDLKDYMDYSARKFEEIQRKLDFLVKNICETQNISEKEQDQFWNT